MHAHVSTESADCDGRYSRSYVLVSDPGQDDFHFNREITSIILGNESEGTATFTSDGFTFDSPTDEGFVHTEIEWCNDSDCAMTTTFRDHSAEAMGY